MEIKINKKGVKVMCARCPIQPINKQESTNYRSPVRESNSIPPTPQVVTQPTPWVGRQPTTQRCGHGISEQMKEKLFIHYGKREIDEQFEKRKEGRKICRENAVYTVIEDPNGFLISVMLLADGQEFFTAPIFSKSNMKMTVLEVEEKKELIYLLSWSGGKQVNLFKPTEKEFRECLEANGVEIKLSRRRAKDMLPIVLAFLIDRANHILIPATKGWYQMKNGEWCFADENSLTYDSIKEAQDGKN